MIGKYPPEVGEAIAELMETYSNIEIANILNGRFPELPAFTASKVCAYKKNHGLKASRRILPRGRSKFPPGIGDFIAENVKGRSYAELAVMVREHFGIEFTTLQARAYAKNHGTISGRDTRFPKGHAPYNKGRRQEEYMTPEQIENSKKNRFQKGRAPHNKMKVGDEAITSSGYRVRKVAEPNKWEPVQRLVWQEHNGPIPEDCILVFLDGDPLNCSIDNLRLVTRAENARLNQNHLRAKDPELTKTGILIAKLMTAAGTKEKELKR